MEETGEPLLLPGLRSFSLKSREEREREKSSQRRRINEHQEKIMRQQLWE